MPETLATPTPAATTRRPTHITVEQFIFRTKTTARYNLGTVLNVLWVDGRWTHPDQRDAAERDMRRGIAIETKHARYQVIPEHREGSTP